MRRAVLVLAALFITVSCSEERERSSGVTRLPSCTLPICSTPCACDQTTTCDMSCDSCDPECGECRAADAQCRMPSTGTDAGPIDNNPPDGGTNPGRDASVVVDAGPCSFPVSQGLSEPCCLSFGIDACGAGLFCAAFDGRTQATCYSERSRQALETCTANNQCASNACSGSGQCVSQPGEQCEPNVGCTATSGRYACDDRAAPFTCVSIDGSNGSYCQAPSDCSSGDCTDHTCRAGTGDFCNQNEECASNACINQNCSCSPFITASCDPGTHCAFLPPEGTRCFQNGSVGLGGNCSGLEDCQAPLTCAQLTSGGQPVCVMPCQLPDHPCPSGATCFAPFPQINFGVCPE